MHWPRGLKTRAGARTDQPGIVSDFMPTVLQLAGATYPKERNDQSILPFQGQSLVPIFNGATLPPRVLCVEHEGNRMVREGNWKLVARADKPWELYNLADDPTEMRDLSAREPARAQKMNADWESWAENSMVKPKPNPVQNPASNGIANPQIVGKALSIRCDVAPQSSSQDGVIVAQGGNQRGYALYLNRGKPVFAVRQAGKLFTVLAPAAPRGRFSLEARLEKDGAMTLAVNGTIVARGQAPGVFMAQPQDELSVGQDTLSAVGDYTAPNALQGQVENVKVEVR